MIDWLNLLFNALWIAGCSIALATVSYASWAGSVQGTKLKEELNYPTRQTFLNIAGLLFSTGLAGTSVQTYERVLWVILAALFFLQIVLLLAERKQSGNH